MKLRNANGGWCTPCSMQKGHGGALDARAALMRCSAAAGRCQALHVWTLWHLQTVAASSHDGLHCMGATLGASVHETWHTLDSIRHPGHRNFHASRAQRQALAAGAAPDHERPAGQAAGADGLAVLTELKRCRLDWRERAPALAVAAGAQSRLRLVTGVRLALWLSMPLETKLPAA